MKLTELLTAAQNKTLTYSMAAQLLADQPTAGEESHAHMHTLDPFSVDTTKIKPDNFKCPPELVASGLVKMRKAFWENPELHLHPAGDYASMKALKGTAKAMPFDGPADSTFTPYNFYMDKSRLAENDTYLKRGMDAIPEKFEDVHSQTLVFKRAGAAKAEGGTAVLPTLADRKAAPVDAAVIQDKITTKAVKVNGSFLAMEAHSMFEDSESLVMCTACVLASDAGITALNALKGRPAGGSYIAVYSATAVTAVSAAYAANNAGAPLKVAERSPVKVELDATKQPKARGGGKFLKNDIRRVVLVLKPTATGDLVIVTCYPTSKPDQIPALPAAIPPPTASDDVVELDKGADLFAVVKQAAPLSLKW